MNARHLEVFDPGPLTTIQDLGRPGYGHVGVAPSGAADRHSAALANRLVGNPEDAAVLETTLRGPRLRLGGTSSRGVVVAVTGAPAPVHTDGRIGDMNRALYLSAGTVLDIGAATSGIRSYIALGGGLLAAPVLGSRSYDLLSGLGPPPLRAGDLLQLGDTTGSPPAVDVVPVASIGDLTVLTALLGPRHEWFTPQARTALSATAWHVSSDSNRIGLRLTGARLTRQRDGQLPPEGLIIGSIQVPPDGQPVVFLSDHPSTGGYPVIAVLDESSLPRAAQARPGTRVQIVLRAHSNW